jgi:hypothetical protein
VARDDETQTEHHEHQRFSIHTNLIGRIGVPKQTHDLTTFRQAATIALLLGSAPPRRGAILYRLECIALFCL